MARLRSIGMSRSLKHLSEEVHLSHDDPFIDFSSAGLYLVGLQTTVATVACAATSVACCWLLSADMISAVRTLAITAVVAFLCMRKAIRIGRVRGVTTIFNALRPCVVVYICVLTIEQLVHTCVPLERNKQSGSTRMVVFHCAIALMAAAGLWRAARPTAETDAPFLVTVFAIIIIAMMPPPSTALTGPLCEAATLFSAGDRLMRAFLFSALYVIHVYCSPPKRNSIHELALCVMRCAAAGVWVLGCHIFVTWVALIQAIVALWARFGSEPSAGSYTNVDTRSDAGLSDAELGGMASMQLERDENGVLIPPWQRDTPMHNSHHGFSSSEPIVPLATSITNGHAGSVSGCQSAYAPAYASPAAPLDAGFVAQTPHAPETTSSHQPAANAIEGVRVDPRQLVNLVGHGGHSMSRERLAAIAASM